MDLWFSGVFPIAYLKYHFTKYLHLCACKRGVLGPGSSLVLVTLSQNAQGSLWWIPVFAEGNLPFLEFVAWIRDLTVSGMPSAGQFISKLC